MAIQSSAANPRAGMDIGSVINGLNVSLNFVKEGAVYIFGDFDETILTNVVPDFVQAIEAKKSQKDAKIPIYINSHGGWTFCLMPLLSLIERAKKQNIIVETHVHGIAYSCGSLLAVAGTPGHRHVGEHAEHCCHLGQATLFARNDTELQRVSERAQAHFDFVRAMYKRHAKIENLDLVIRDDALFFRGEEIIRQGLADTID